MITATPRSAPASDLRAEYLDLLPEPQELFVERLVAAGTWWSIRQGDEEIGYAVTDGDATLVEMHLAGRGARRLAAAFDVLIETCGVRRVLAKTFDATLLFAALSRPCRIETKGMLYRVIADATFKEDPKLRGRAATLDDVASLTRLGAGFFRNTAEVDDYIGSDGLMIYETREPEGVAVGAGVMKRVVADRDAVDIGMVVHPEHRRRGYGSYIIAHLKSHCLARGWRPICGCSIHNTASQRTPERAGFASRHLLLDIELQRSGALSPDEVK
jgi:GNAT superfamily N-acetyltransferase